MYIGHNASSTSGRRETAERRRRLSWRLKLKGERRFGNCFPKTICARARRGSAPAALDQPGQADPSGEVTYKQMAPNMDDLLTTAACHLSTVRPLLAQQTRLRPALADNHLFRVSPPCAYGLAAPPAGHNGSCTIIVPIGARRQSRRRAHPARVRADPIVGRRATRQSHARTKPRK